MHEVEEVEEKEKEEGDEYTYAHTSRTYQPTSQQQQPNQQRVPTQRMKGSSGAKQTQRKSPQRVIRDVGTIPGN